jgi:hypothetical protein
MMRRLLLLCTAIVLLTALVACAQQPQLKGTFVRYESAPGGRQLAIVDIPTQDAQTKAWVRIDDLEKGDKVLVEFPGKAWDEPSWAPDASVIGRVN